MTPRTRVPRPALVALGAGMFAVALGTVATSTAAWTDPGRFAVEASTGEWGAPTNELGECEVLQLPGPEPVPDSYCTITTLDVRNVYPGDGTDIMEIHAEFEASHGPVGYVYWFRVDASAAEDGPDWGQQMPEDWNWDTSATLNVDSYDPVPGYRCDSLPIVEGIAKPTETPRFTIMLAEDVDAPAANNRNCEPPP